MMRRVLSALLVVFVVAMTVPTGAVAGSVVQENATATPTPRPGLSTTPAPTATPTATATPSPTATPTPSPTPVPGVAGDSESGLAASVRILPVQFEESFLETRTIDQGQAYNTTGPFAMFALGESVDRVVIDEPKASAQALEGGRVVRVSYDDDAAPVGSRSLYHLRLYFADGSQRVVELYAERTSVSTGSAQLQKYRPVVMEMLNDAEDAGYERSPDGLESHYGDLQETAQLLNSLLSEQARRLALTVISLVSNPLGIATILLTATAIAYWQLKRRGWVLDLLSEDSGKAARLRERLWLETKKRQQTAAEEPLSDLQAVGEMGQIYWKDAFGVSTVFQLAELARDGIPVERDGEVVKVGGVESVDPQSPEDSYLEAVCRAGRLPSPEMALTHQKAALRRMMSEYGQGHRYDEAYQRTRELLDELDESRDINRYASHSSDGVLGGAAPAGGDD